MEIGISTASFFPYETTEDAAGIIQGMGAACAEVFSQTFSEYAPAFGEAVHRRYPNLRVHSVHALTQHYEVSMFSPARRQREEAWALYEDMLAAGAAMGARVYVMHGQASVKRPDFVPGLGKMLEVLRPALELAARYGMRLSLENVHWAMGRDPETLRQLRRELPALGFTLDIKQAWQGGREIEPFLDAAQGAICNLHISDRCADGRSCLPGRGETDFPALFARFRDAGYDDIAMVEVYSDSYTRYDEMRESLEFLQNLV